MKIKRGKVKSKGEERKVNKVVGGILFLTFYLLIFTFSACDLFNGTTDNDLLAKIDAEIAYANAPWVPVQIENGGLGTSTPGQGSHSQVVKLGYSFTHRFQPARDYPDVGGWQAWYAGQEPFAVWQPGEAAIGEELVMFVPANEAATEMEIFVYIMPPAGNLFIGPLGAHLAEQPIRVMADPRWGTVFAESILQRKQGFSFEVEFAASGSWDFMGWKAYPFNNQSADNLTPGTLGVELPPEDVYIEVTGIGRAVVTVNTAAAVLLVPFCVTPVRVDYTNPPYGSPTVYHPSQTITIMFSTQLDKDTVKFEDGFFQITEQSGAAPVDISAHYKLSYNDEAQTVTITPEDPLTVDTTITVTVNTGVKGKYGNNHNTLSSFSFSVSTEGVVVKNVYTASEVWAVHDTAQYTSGFFSQWANNERDRRIRKNTDGKYEVTLYFGVQAEGEIDNDIDHDIEIKEIHYAHLNGDEISGALGRIVAEGKGTAVITENTENSGAGFYYQQQNNTAGMKYYKAVYTWDNPTQGIIRLVVLPSGGLVEPLAVPEMWETVVAEGRSYITVAYDNIAPGGPELVTFDGFADYDLTTGIYEYNANHNSGKMELTLNLRNIRDNFNSLNNSVNGNLNASGGKPRTMDSINDIRWQMRIEKGGGYYYYPNNDAEEWNALIATSGDTLHDIDLGLEGIILNENTPRSIEVRYKDSLGNEGTWNEIGKIRYYTPNVAPLSSWSVTYSASSGAYTVDWTTAATDIEGIEVSLNGGVQWQQATNKPYTIPNLTLQPINTLNVRSGEIERATETRVMVRTYNHTVRHEETPEIRIFNSVGMTITSTRNATTGEYATTTGGVSVIVVDNNNMNTAFTSANLGAVFLLAENIELSNWTPFGDSTTPFTGKLYGNGHSIIITSMSDAAGGAAAVATLRDIGLFGMVSGTDTNPAIIRDLTVVYAGSHTITNPATGSLPDYNLSLTLDPTGSTVGGITGLATGNTTIVNCIVRGVSNADAIGLSAENREITLTVSASSPAPSTESFNVILLGGIAGYFEGSGKIENCRAALSVSYISSGHTGRAYVGGIAGATGAGNTANTIHLNNQHGFDDDINRLLINNVTVTANVLADKGMYNHILALGGAVGRSENNTMRGIEFTNGKVSFNRTISNQDNCIGGIAGQTSQTNVVDCSFMGSIGVIDQTDPPNVTVSGSTSLGGLIGYSRGDNSGGIYYFHNNSAPGNIEFMGSSTKSVGGLFGSSADTIYITDCFFKGNINVSGSGTSSVGGFIGYLGIGPTINNCGSQEGTITVDTSSGHIFVGGFSSSLGAYGNISNCFSKIDIITNSTANTYVGGFVGNLASGSASINTCYATGTVRSVQNGNTSELNSNASDNHVNIGGLVGLKLYGGTISNSYALGNVIADKQGGTGRLHAGGLVGFNSDGNINNSFSTGLVSAKSASDEAYAGGLVGYRAEGIISNSAALGASVTAQSASARGAGRIYGYPATNEGSNNFAREGMRVQESFNYAEPFPPAIDINKDFPSLGGSPVLYRTGPVVSLPTGMTGTIDNATLPVPIDWGSSSSSSVSISITGGSPNSVLGGSPLWDNISESITNINLASFRLTSHYIEIDITLIDTDGNKAVYRIRLSPSTNSLSLTLAQISRTATLHSSSLDKCYVSGFTVFPDSVTPTFTPISNPSGVTGVWDQTSDSITDIDLGSITSPDDHYLRFDLELSNAGNSTTYSYEIRPTVENPNITQFNFNNIQVLRSSASSRHGQPVSDDSFYSPGIWTSLASSGMGFSATYWSTTRVGTDGHPRLKWE